MTWQVVRLQDSQSAPWRNGGGTTRELVAWPNAADWQWRMSVAEITADGPFSQFSDVQRWFAVLQGAGVALTVNGRLHELTRHSQPMQFDGALLCACQLLDGATQDFNLMVRGGASAHMYRVNGGFQMTTTTPKIIAAYAQNEAVTVQFDSKSYGLSPYSLGWTHVEAGTTLDVHAGNTLLIEIGV